MTEPAIRRAMCGATSPTKPTGPTAATATAASATDSGGIWEALLTTAVGLAVAMPVVVVLNWLERKVDRLAHEMDSTVTSLFTEDLSEDFEPSERGVFHEPARIRSVAAAGE